MNRADEINKALDIVLVALNNGEVESTVRGEHWSSAAIISNGFKYRAKCEPREWFICWDEMKDNHTPIKRPNASVYPCPPFNEEEVNNWANVVKVREVTYD